MQEAILNFNKQFEWEPEVSGDEKHWSGEDIVVCGMGGSHLGAGLLKLHSPDLPIRIHRDYGLPSGQDLDKAFLIASSYSGNTEEVVDFLNKSLETGWRPSVVSAGGELSSIAEVNNLRRVLMPRTVIQPRVALGLSLLSLSKILGLSDILFELKSYKDRIIPENFMEEGRELAGKIFKKTVLIYSSNKNKEISYNWKVKINETAKIPAFANVLPEMNHNEIAGFMSHKGAPNFEAAAIFIEDSLDSDRNKKRMDITKKILSENGISVFPVSLRGDLVLERALNSLLLADWIGYHLAVLAKLDPDTVPVIADFKNRMNS